MCTARHNLTAVYRQSNVAGSEVLSFDAVGRGAGASGASVARAAIDNRAVGSGGRGRRPGRQLARIRLCSCRGTARRADDHVCRAAAPGCQGAVGERDRAYAARKCGRAVGPKVEDRVRTAIPDLRDRVGVTPTVGDGKRQVFPARRHSDDLFAHDNVIFDCKKTGRSAIDTCGTGCAPVYSAIGDLEGGDTARAVVVHRDRPRPREGGRPGSRKDAVGDVGTVSTIDVLVGFDPGGVGSGVGWFRPRTPVIHHPDRNLVGLCRGSASRYRPGGGSAA